MSGAARVFIVDDDAAVRDSLAMLLDAAGYTVVTFPGAKDFLNAYSPDTPGCIIIDVDMPDMDGPALQQELIQLKSRLPVIFLSGKGTIPLTVRTIKAGAMDFLTKPVEASILLSKVRDALEQALSQQKQDETNQADALKLERLTEREREILMLVGEGLTSKEIAQKLDISPRTVDNHRASIMQKTDTSRTLGLVRIAIIQASG